MTLSLQSQVEQPLGRMFSFLGKGYLHLLRSRLKHLDIDRNYFALVLIGNHEGEVTQQELALLLDTDKVSIVRVVDYLSEKGYVQRLKKKDDRRKHSLVLTDKAKLALPEIKKSFSEINEIVLNGLQSSETSELAASIEKIKNNITGNLHIL
jgi:MarR family transcriptional regulator, transcriptional regulator for hemolysin